MKILWTAAAGCLLAMGGCKAQEDIKDPDKPTIIQEAVPEPVAAAPSTTIRCQGFEQTITNSSTVPKVPDFSTIKKFTVDTLQCAFDAYSWDLFLALNHDAQGNFVTGTNTNSTVWQDWAESSDIFLPGGEKPPSIGGLFPPRDIPEACQDLDDGKTRVVRQVGKRPDVLEEFTEPFSSGPLIDTNGNYTRFAISVNKSMYDYILDNVLYSKEGQSAFTAAGNEVNFLCSCDAPTGTGDPDCAPNGQQGAIMAKAAWKVLDGSDDPSKFHTINALVYTEATGGSAASCSSQTVGLTGLHIAQKNHSDTQWLWSTFEHVDNVPTQGQTPTQSKYNYYVPDCDDCNDVNVPPKQPWNPHAQPVAGNINHSQVERVIPITDDANAMNAQVQTDLLSGSVWANYHLISTQWPTNPNAPGGVATAENNWCSPINEADKAGAPAPVFLANTTLETYIQGTVPQASSSCINCHLNATMTDGQFSDFTYLLERAKGASQ